MREKPEGERGEETESTVMVNQRVCRHALRHIAGKLQGPGLLTVPYPSYRLDYKVSVEVMFL